MPTRDWAGTRDWDEPFATLLTQLRRAAGLTQEQLADVAGLSVRAISSLECGVRHPRRFTLDRLADALRLSAAQRGELIASAQRARQSHLTSAPTAGAAALVGRGSTVAVVREHLTGDGPAVLVLAGESGIGKSRMLTEAAALGAALGLAVLVGAATPGGDDFAPLAQALADHIRRASTAMLTGCAALGLLLPEVAHRLPAAPVTGPDRRLAFDAVARYLANIARGRRVLLILDDLQWAGAEAGALLLHLVRRVAGPQVRVVAGLRPDEAPTGSPVMTALADLARHGELHGCPLAALTAAQSEALVTTLTLDAPLTEPERARVLRRAGGLPLFLVELSRAAGEDIPWHLRLAIGQQLADLPPAALRLLRLLAISGPGAALGPLSATELDGLDIACRRGILLESRQGLRFRYPLVRETLATGLGPVRRRLWRESLAASA